MVAAIAPVSEADRPVVLGSPGQRTAAQRARRQLRTDALAAFGDKCAWCGLAQARPQQDHFPPLVVDRMWTGYTMDIRVPSCAADNRQYGDWQRHLDACWRSTDMQLRERHRATLQRLWEMQQRVPGDVYRNAFTLLRDELDAALFNADERISDLAADWYTEHPYEAKDVADRLDGDVRRDTRG